mmetsp:Transcript_33611/g.73366  ORF Transcript_33611/g.73366 Transcript_33611/m.73366 type:complete len:211 (+) Transcript_33611:114-746(+)
MDDLDNLLNDLNSTLGGKTTSAQSSYGRPTQSQPTTTSKPAYRAEARPSYSSEPTLDDLDDLLGDLNQISTTKGGPAFSRAPPAPEPSRNTYSQPQPSTNRGAKVKCGCPNIGGTAYRMGAAGIGETVCCDRLLCTKCDLAVVSFPDCKWSADANYMFFRNGYPDERKLSSSRGPKKGSRAYCCQCTWTDAEKAEGIGFNSPLRWVCRGH